MSGHIFKKLKKLFSSTLQDYCFCLDREYLLWYMDGNTPNIFFSDQMKYKDILRTTHILESIGTKKKKNNL